MAAAGVLALLLLAWSATDAVRAQHTTLVWQTAKGTADRLSPQQPLTWFITPGYGAAGENVTTVVIDAGTQHQTITGFGGAITESAAYVYSKLDAAAQQQVLLDLWGENAEGTSLAYTSGRLTIGSCDFSLASYSYDDVTDDANMTHFSVAHDEALVLPLAKAAVAAAAAAGRSVAFLSSPWSPPAWMKSNGRMSCAPLGPLNCRLLPQFYDAYALYFSRYISAYVAAGVPIWAITVQNEPEAQTGTLTYEGVYMPAGDELAFVTKALGPRLRADHPEVKIYGFDHNKGKSMVEYAKTLLSDKAGAPFFDGIAFHWYTGPAFDSLAALHALFPGVDLLSSEATLAHEKGSGWRTPSWANGEHYGGELIGDLLNWSSGFLDWNILLDGKGGPDHGDPTGARCEGLIQCGSDAMLIADLDAKPVPVVYKQAWYWYVGHVSRFVPRGSVRLGTATTFSAPGPSPVLAVAFATPAGATVLVAMNPLDTPEALVVRDARYGAATTTLPPHSIQTWRF